MSAARSGNVEAARGARHAPVEPGACGEGLDRCAPPKALTPAPGSVTIDQVAIEGAWTRELGLRLERALLPVLPVVAEHLGYVVDRLWVGRNAAVAHHCAFTRVLGGDGQLDIAVEQVGEHAQVAHAAEDVLARIEGVRHQHASRRFWDQLHEATRVGG